MDDETLNGSSENGFDGVKEQSLLKSSPGFADGQISVSLTFCPLLRNSLKNPDHFFVSSKGKMDAIQSRPLSFPQRHFLLSTCHGTIDTLS